jgi:hypothetical protein
VVGPPLDGPSKSYARALCATNALHWVLRCHIIEDDERRAGRTATAITGHAIDCGGSNRVSPREVAGDLRLSYQVASTAGNTPLMEANDSAKPIDLENKHFDELLAESNPCVGRPGRDWSGQVDKCGGSRAALILGSTRRSSSASRPGSDCRGASKASPQTTPVSDRDRVPQNLLVRPTGALSSFSFDNVGEADRREPVPTNPCAARAARKSATRNEPKEKSWQLDSRTRPFRLQRWESL